ncbi:hypothetical protein D3C86_1616010 [compost metagenome]
MAHELLQIGQQDLHAHAAPCKNDRLDPAPQQLACQLARLQDGAFTHPQLLIHNRRIIKHKVLLPRRRTIIVNQRNGFTDQTLRVLLGIINRR